MLHFGGQGFTMLADLKGLGAVAELERSLIAERIGAGLRNAVAKGKRLGRPSRNIDGTSVTALRDQGASWRTIARKLGVGIGTLYRTRWFEIVSRSAERFEFTHPMLDSHLQVRMQ